MGLLSKAQLLDQKEKDQKKQGGILSKAESKNGGQFEKAEKYGEIEEPESDKGERKGLLRQAAMILAGEEELSDEILTEDFAPGVVDPDEIVLEEGVLTEDMLADEESAVFEGDINLKDKAEEPETGRLLERTSLLDEKTLGKDEAAVFEEEPQDEIPGGLLMKATLMRESEKREVSSAEIRGVKVPAGEKSGEEAPAASKEEAPVKAKKPAPSSRAGKGAVEKGRGKAAGEKAVVALRIPDPLLVEQWLSGGYTQRVITLFNDISRQEGYPALCEAVAETMSAIGRGKTCILFLYKNGRQTVECIYPEASLDKKAGKISFTKNSPFIKSLESDTGKHLRYDSIKEETVLKEIKKLDAMQPWTAYPLPSDDGLTGLIVVGGQAKRQKSDTGSVSLFLHLAELYLRSYIKERESQKKLEKIKAEKAEIRSIIDMYGSPDKFSGTDRDKIFDEAMRNMYTDLEIDSAALVTGWGSPGKLVVEHSIGIPKNILGKYRVSKTDNKIKSVIKSREPAVLPDAARRISKLSKKKDDLLRSYIVLPVLFCDEVLAVLNIHGMKGAGKKLTKSVKERLKHAALSIAPFILSNKLMSANPWAIMESFLNGETAKARRKRKPLNLVMFSVDNGKKVLDNIGFGRYWGYVERLHRIIAKNIEGNAAVRAVDWNKTILSLREMEKGEAAALIRQIKKEFNDSFKGPKKDRAVNISSSATIFPEESKNLAAILEAIY